MKTLRRMMAMTMMLLSTLSVNAVRMSYYEMRDHARFLTDRMMYVLNLNSVFMDELYCINYDYICGVNDYLDDIAMGYRYEDYTTVLLSRDHALRLLLGDAVWSLLTGYDYFYRPIVFANHQWSFAVYAHDRWNRRMFFDRPRHFDDYRGGHYFGGMAVGHEMDRRGDMRDNNMSRNDNMRSNDNRTSDVNRTSNVNRTADSGRNRGSYGNSRNEGGRSSNRESSSVGRSASRTDVGSSGRQTRSGSEAGRRESSGSGNGSRSGSGSAGRGGGRR